MRGQPITVEILTKIAAVYCAGNSNLRDLAAQHGVNYLTLRGRASDLGWAAVRKAARATLINPPSSGVKLDHTIVYEAQVRFQSTAPAQCDRALRGLLRLAKEAEKEGLWRDAGFLLKSYIESAAVVRDVLGITFAEKLQLNKAANHPAKEPMQLPTSTDPASNPTDSANQPVTSELQEPAPEHESTIPQDQSEGPTTDIASA